MQNSTYLSFSLNALAGLFVLSFYIDILYITWAYAQFYNLSSPHSRTVIKAKKSCGYIAPLVPEQSIRPYASCCSVHAQG
ncbi:hypothetical protein F4859DRAFT_477652 [Xylaria cf. heliscus]|nr:hypothetical protein F4859DRAFT_477652 [Xylaria cf. heliscus]